MVTRLIPGFNCSLTVFLRIPIHTCKAAYQYKLFAMIAAHRSCIEIKIYNAQKEPFEISTTMERNWSVSFSMFSRIAQRDHHCQNGECCYQHER